MPTVNPSSFRYGNPAVAVALKPRFSFAQARQDRQAAYEIELRRNQLLKDRVLEKNQKEAAVAQSFEAISQLGLLTPDNARAMTFNQSALEDLQGKIKNEYGGDALRFLQVEGDQWNNNFKVNFANSPTLQRAILNKSNKGLADADANKEYRMVTWATQTPDGQQVRKTGSYEENLGDFLTGATKELNYSGGFDFDLAEIKKFANTHPDPSGNQHPYMSPEDVKAWAVQNKISQDDAQLWVDRHYEKVKEGLQWDNYAVQVKDAELENQRNRIELAKQAEAGKNARQRAMIKFKEGQAAPPPVNALVPTEPVGQGGSLPIMPELSSVNPFAAPLGSFSWQPHRTSEQAKNALYGLFGINSAMVQATGANGRPLTKKDQSDNQVPVLEKRALWLPAAGQQAYYRNGSTGRLEAVDASSERFQPLYQVSNAGGTYGLPVGSVNMVVGTIEANGQQQQTPMAQIQTTDGRWFYVPYDPQNVQSAVSQQKIAVPANKGQRENEQGIIEDIQLDDIPID